MRSRRAAALATTLGLLGGGAAWTVGPAIAESPATADDTAPDDTEPDDEIATTAADDPAADEPAADEQSDDGPGSDEQAGDDDSTPADAGATDESSRTGGNTSWIDEVLAPLVDDGTITQEQADAVTAALQDARPFRDAGRRVGLSIGLDTLTDALGVTADELSAAFAAGQSIADIAEAQGIDVQTVIEALVGAASARIDEAVADGQLTEDEGASRLETATARITELVDQAGGPSLPDRPSAPEGPGFPGGPAFPGAPGTPGTEHGDLPGGGHPGRGGNYGR